MNRIRHKPSGGSRAALPLFLLVILGFGCAGVPSRDKPAWIDSEDHQFPANQYLVGMGQASSKPAAAERAYGAVARIFTAKVTAQARDWESYVLIENRGRSHDRRHLTLEQLTQVSTDKVLENVRILDTWFDPGTRIHYALAGMNRQQAEAAMLERIADLDRRVDTELAASQESQDKLAKIRNMKRAVNHLVLREAYNTDLRVIRASGQGLSARHSVAELAANLEVFLANNLAIGVEVRGEQAEATKRAVIEGLIREGLPVTDQPSGSERSQDNLSAVPPLDLLVKGSVRLWKAELRDPTFQYVRWCSDFIIMEVATDHIVGAVSRSGREGHLTEQEAKNRALRIMEQELTADLAKSLAGYVYGDTEQPRDETPPAACPREEERA